MRAALFIDEANIYFSQKTLKWEVDFEKIYGYFEKHFALYNSFFYAAEPPPEESEKKIEYQRMSLMGYTMRLKRLKEIRNPKGEIVAKKANLDIEMAVDMIATKDNYDIAILFTGDSDFIRAVEMLRTMGKQIFVFSTKGHSAIDLINAADKFIDMQKMKKNFTLTKTKKSSSKTVKKESSSSKNKSVKSKPEKNKPEKKESEKKESEKKSQKNISKTSSKKTSEKKISLKGKK